MSSGRRTRIHLLRHGQVEGHQTRRYNGQGDTALTPLGKQQSQRLAERLSRLPLTAVYSSDLQRCRQLADRLVASRGFAPVYRSDLRELHIGDWEGRPWAELQLEDAVLWQTRLEDIVNVAAPGGESVLQLAQRLRPLLHEILLKHTGEEIAVVGHGAVNRVLLLDALGAPLKQVFRLEQDYACHNIIDYNADGSALIRALNLSETTFVAGGYR